MEPIEITMETATDSINSRQNGNNASDENQDEGLKQKDNDSEKNVDLNDVKEKNTSHTSVKEKNTSHTSVKKKSSTLKRKKIDAPHLIHHATATGSVPSPVMQPQIHKDESNKGESNKVKEVRSKPVNTKPSVQPKRDILQQKYQELHQLLVLPLVQPISKNVLNIGQLLHLQSLNQNTNNDVMSGSEQDTTNLDKNVSEKNEKNIAKLNFLQSSQKPSEQETKYSTQSGADTFNDEGYIQWVRRNKNKPHNSKNEEDKQENQMQTKKQIFQPSDTFLKNTNNPMIKQWLKRKEKEMRWRKREERRKLKVERLKKQEQEMLRQEKFKDSGQKVREWMIQKRKEIVRNLKENTVQKNDKINHSNSVQIFPLLEGSDTSAAALPSSQGVLTLDISLKEPNKKPSSTSFVYARPVSGRVRLIKLQKESKENAKRKELEKQLVKEQLEKEKTKRMRVSYDQWLLRKREDDYSKRQEAARMRALAKSDSELDNIGVDLAQKRIKSFMRKKENFVNELNKSFKDEDSCQTGEKKIKVLGSKKSINIRPSSAKPSVSPRISASIHRPLSASPAPTFLGQDSNKQEKTIYSIPYPPDKGAPKYVLDKQQKLFSPHLTSIHSIEQPVNSNEANVTSELISQNKTNDDQQNAASTDLRHEPFMKKNTSETKIMMDNVNYDINRNFIESNEPNTTFKESNQRMKKLLNSDVDNLNKVNESCDTQKLTILEQIVNSYTLTDDVKAASLANEIVLSEFNSSSISENYINDVNDFDSKLEHNVEKKTEVNIAIVTEDDTLTGLEEIADLSVSKNSGRHVSFQDSPVIFESSDTEISSQSSEYNEIEEVLSDENDNF